MLRLPAQVYTQIVAHCLSGLPDEACGLIGGDLATGEVVRCYPTRNLAASAKLYTVDPKQHLQADRDAEAHGMAIMGVFHSHTHTDAYPSPTDVAQAPDPQWHYVLVSLRDISPMLRSYRIVDQRIEEEAVIVAPHQAYGSTPDGERSGPSTGVPAVADGAVIGGSGGMAGSETPHPAPGAVG
jgi:proteasome lid subunit RPN8/RPN11